MGLYNRLYVGLYQRLYRVYLTKTVPDELGNLLIFQGLVYHIIYMENQAGILVQDQLCVLIVISRDQLVLIMKPRSSFRNRDCNRQQH